MRARPLRLSPLGKFSLLSLVAVATLSLVIGAVLQARIEEHALRESERMAKLIGEVAIQTKLRPTDLDRPLGYDRLSELDVQLQNRFVDEVGLKRVKLFDARGTIVYSDDPTLIGERPDSEHLRIALGRRMLSQPKHGPDHSGRGEHLLEVYMTLS